ncbi:MAG: heavy-metal-associated protein [Paucimonas sp.]|nr:heavy-metal-associated protein [Paucimonas sp.]
MTMHEFRVEGMSCGHCAGRVTQSVKAIDRQARVDVDLGNGKVRVESSADAEILASAMTEAGYPAGICR